MSVQEPILRPAREHSLPGWLAELRSGLAVRPHFVISGNIRDVYPVLCEDGPAFLPAADALWAVLDERGYAGLLLYDPVGGARLHPARAASVAGRLAAAGIELATAPGDLEALAALLARVVRLAALPLAVLIDYASLLGGGAPGLPDAAGRRFFIACDKLAHEAQPLAAPGRPVALPFNPVIWMVNRPGDLPDWFTIGNEAIHALTARLPDLEERFAMAHALSDHFPDTGKLAPARRRHGLEQLALETDGMTLRSLRTVCELARAEAIGLTRVSDAVRAYRIGTPRNPWRAGVMRARIGAGEAALIRRVKGQDHAVKKSLDILIRSVMGLSATQSSSRHGRPRGVLFFAGPTGVGKTELAKAITELLFGDETAYHRFDMSEFSAENSESRLVGAPPGYAGHDDGGELVNAARGRPFGVFLFDEIEKAHPSILDKFLQIIDEGRLTDGRGETVHFSESLLIFTSNIGMFGDDRQLNMSMNVLPSDSYDEIESKIVGAIREHFRFRLRRPELINRIGQNIVVFEFIRPESAILILRHMVDKVLDAVRQEHGIEVRIAERAMQRIQALCLYDLFEGGRGIGNRLETVFVNPLARLLFDRAAGAPPALTIAAVEGQGAGCRLVEAVE